MKRLDRSAVPAPPCLAKYDPTTHTWDDIGHDKTEVRTHLAQLQGERCAYCEGDLNLLGQHIEHFRRKSRHRHLTFAWGNLYWSCDQTDSCGHHKDHGAGAYDPNDLVDPGVDDPDRFFRFRADGTIQIRGGLDAEEVHRARETLRVFNLHADFGRLRNMRKAAAGAYIADVDSLADFSPQDRNAYIQAEIQATAGEPFSTVIRHILEDVL